MSKYRIVNGLRTFTFPERNIEVAGLDDITVNSVFSRTGNIVANTGDYTVAQITGAAPLASPTFTGVVTSPSFVGALTGNASTVTDGVYTNDSYSDPSWITGLAWSKITSKPTTLTGYGITDAVTTNTTQTGLSGNKTWIGQHLFTGGTTGFGTNSPTASSNGIDIASGGIALVLGADNNASTRTNLTGKIARIGGYHYTNIEEPIAAFIINAVSGANQIYIGGGSGAMNAVNDLRFYTAANTTTLTGTDRGGFNSSGLFDLQNLNASSVVVSDGSKKLISSTTTATELGYLSGVTSSIQTQIGTKQNLVTLTTTGSGAATFTQSTGALNIPNLTGSFVDLTTPQTVAGAKTFSSAIIVSSVAGTGVSYSTGGFIKSVAFSNYAIGLPSATGTIALTSDLTGFVDTVNTQTIGGVKTFDNYISLLAQSTIGSDSTHAGFSYSSTTNGFRFSPKSGDGSAFTFTSLASGAVSLAVPNASGTIALKDDIKYGATLVTFNGTDTVFNIPHGMATTPTSISITFGDASNLNFTQSTRTLTSTNIVITCTTPPLAGSQTVYWQAYK